MHGGRGQSWRNYTQVAKRMLAENVLTCLEPKSQKAHYCFCHPLANITTHYYNLSRGPKGHMLLKRAGFRKLARAVKSWQSGAPHLGSIKHISLWASKQKVHPPPPPPALCLPIWAIYKCYSTDQIPLA